MKLLGQAELTEYLGISGRTIWEWRTKGLFPSPVAELKCGPIWAKDQIDRWKRKNNQLKLQMAEYDQAKLMSAGEFADEAGLTRWRFNQLKRQDGFPKPSAKYRNRHLYDRGDVKKWLRDRKTQATLSDQ